jgi:hypothetical protein
MTPIDETEEAEAHFDLQTPIKGEHKRDYSVPMASPLLGFAGKVKKENNPYRRQQS